MKKFLAYLLFMIILVSNINIVYALDENNLTTINLTNGVDDEAPSHTHIWSYKYNEYYHWQECAICKAIQNKVSHTLTGNGGSKTLCDKEINTPYREVCSICGYQSKPQIVLHGRYENYKETKRLTYGNMRGLSLNDIKQITKVEFNSLLSSYKVTSDSPGGQEYTWYDDDGDGYGWVFCGGPIIGDSNGTKGTIELIVGTEGDCGRKNRFDEYYMILKYLSSDSTPTRSEFVSYLQSKINSSSNPTLHLCYGYDNKYANKVSDVQFSKIVTEFNGYIPKVSTWGWSTMAILHNGHNNSGNWIFSDTSCYDSNNNHNLSFSDGIQTKCDICDVLYNGNESYVNQTWFICSSAANLKIGETKTCSGHSLYGIGNQFLGKVYCINTRTSSGTTVYWKAIPANGATVTGSSSLSYTKNSDGSLTSSSYTIPHEDIVNFHNWSYPWSVTFTLNGFSRVYNCGCNYLYNDDSNPTAYGYSNETTNNNYWQIIGNGSLSSSSNQLKAKVTFKDLAQYSYNELKVIVYDSDKSTIIKQSNGDTYFPLTKISGTNGTNGSETLWQATIPIYTETNSSKYIYVQAIDSTGNKSDLIPLKISYIDSIGPTITTNVNTTNWTSYKLLTIKAEDVSNISLGISKKDLTFVSNSTYGNSRVYKIVGDIYNDKTLTIYAQDTAGNMSYKTVTISNIDNTPPTITQVSTNKNIGYNTLTISANDFNSTLNKSGSGVTEYAISTSNVAPSSGWQTSNVFNVTTPNTYYVFAKDLVGNISSSYKVNVNINYTLTINPNSGIWNNSSTSQSFTMTNGSTKTIANPSKVGYTFTNWTLNGSNASFNNNTFTMGSSNASLVANYSINKYNVTYIDVIDSINGTQLGKTSKKVNYNSNVRGSDLGSNSSDNAYYNGYYYVSDTSAIVSINGVTVYRIFKLRTLNKTSNLNWNDNNNKNGLRPTNYTLKLLRNGFVFKQIELSSNQTSYTFSNLDKYDSNGNAYNYTFEVDASDRYKMTLYNNGNTINENYQNSTFSVIIPKNISLNGNTGKGSYNIKVNGTLYYNDTLTIIPSNSITLRDRSNISSLKGNITQTTTSFTKSNLSNTNGVISLNKTKFAGKYNGTFNFAIKLTLKN